MVKFILNKKSLMTFGKWSLILFSVVLLGFFVVNFVVPSLAGIQPAGPGAVYINISTADANQTDEFFTCDNVVYIRANISCSDSTVCNGSLSVTANFSTIGGGQTRAGVNVSGSDGQGGWRLFEFNDTVDCSAISITNFQLANVTINASTYDGNTTETWEGPILVNMSIIPNCPPPGEPLPPEVPLLNGTFVTIYGCNSTCSGNDRAEPNATGHYYVCGPNFGGDTTNFTAIAESGNFSSVPLVIDVPGKGKINFTTGVNMSTQQKASAIMQFAVKSIMTGGKIGLNETEWNGQTDPNKPNLNLSARLTIYNVSGQAGITGRPQIFRYAHGNTSGSMCPGGICSDFVWDGENLTFTVSSFSDYGLIDAINVSIHDPANATTKTTPDSGLIGVNFTYNVTWDPGVIVENCTLYGNFTGTWAANASNSTPLVNDTIQGIVNDVLDDFYEWNVYCFNSTGQYDYDDKNFTVTVAIPPVINNTVPVNNSYTQGTNSDLFQADVFDYNLNTSNVTLRYQPPAQAWTSTSLNCYNLTVDNISFTCNTTLDLSSYVEGGQVKYYFEATDDSSNYASNGTQSNYYVLTIDETAPQYSNEGTNVTNGTTIAKGTPIAVYANWTENYVLDKWEILNDTAVGGTLSGSFGSDTWSNTTILTSDIATGTTFKLNITANDTAGNTNYTTTWVWTIDGTAPTYTNNNTNVSSGSTIANRTAILLYAKWNDNIELHGWMVEHNASGGNLANTTFNTTFDTGNWTNYTINVTGSAGDTIQARIFVNDTSGNENYTIPTWSWTIDNTAPKYGNESTSPTSPVEYSPGRSYIFNISWSDNVAVDTVLFEWNASTNYSATSLGSNNYSYTLTDLGVANYTYKWYANDTTNNWNNTGVYTFNITQNTTNPVNLYLNGTLNTNLTVTYPAQVNATAVAVYSNSGTIALYRNETDKTSESGTNVRLGNGTYVYKVNITETVNYTSNSTGMSLYVFVLKGTPTITLTASPGWSNNYGTATNVTCLATSLNNEATANLYRDDVDKNSTDNNKLISLNPGTYNYTCNTTATANYSSASSSNIMNISNVGGIDGYIFLTNTTTGIQGAIVSTGVEGIEIGYTDTNGYYYISGIPVGTYTVTVSKDGYYSNSTSSVSVSSGTTQVNMSITGPESFNVSIPGQTYGDSSTFWTSSVFNYFRLSTKPFAGLTTNYTIENIFTSVSGNFTIIYRYNTTNGWTSYVPGATNDLTSIASSVDDYYIMPNATERLEYGAIYT